GHAKDSQGSIDQLRMHTKLSMEESSFLWTIWTSLLSLKHQNPCIESIESYAIPNHADKTHPKIMGFPDGIVNSRSNTGRWIGLSNNENRNRGVMVVRLTIFSRQLYILEIEKVSKGKRTTSKPDHL